MRNERLLLMGLIIYYILQQREFFLLLLFKCVSATSRFKMPMVDFHFRTHARCKHVRVLFQLALL